MAFDYLRCSYPLPVAGANRLLFQTRSTPPPQALNDYVIRVDGTLWRELYDVTPVNDPLLKGLGEMFDTRRRTNQRWAQVDGFTGIIEFQTHHVCDPQLKFRAVFESGVLGHIEKRT